MSLNHYAEFCGSNIFLNCSSAFHLGAFHEITPVIYHFVLTSFSSLPDESFLASLTSPRSLSIPTPISIPTCNSIREHHKTSAKFQSSHIFIEIRTFLELEFILRLIHKCSGVTKSIRNFLHRPIVSRLIYPQELMSSRLLANNTVWI